MIQLGPYRVAADLLRVRDARGKVIATLAWGDAVRVVRGDAEGIAVDIGFDGRRRRGRVHSRLDGALVPEGDDAAPRVLKVDFVDVQQGDGAVLEAPDGTVVLIDGGENKLFARYLAARFAGTSADTPKRIACIVVTHGDADHFSGLAQIRHSERDRSGKRLFLHPARVYHNGLVKGPSSLPDVDAFGRTEDVAGRRVIVDLHDDLRTVPEVRMNRPFLQWRRVLADWTKRGELEIRRIERGDDDAFAFLRDAEVDVRVLGPLAVSTGAGRGLPFLSTPPPRVGRAPGGRGAPSASHTINGHSIVLLVRYGDVRFLLAGDLNEEAERSLVDDHEGGAVSLSAEVLKVPHHGSADYSPPFLRRVAPVVSVVSSGDEQETKEHVHPRATLLGALGRFARRDIEEPVIFVTELAAFFRVLGAVNAADGRRVFGFERTAFGVVHCRTDGKRLLVYTDTGKADRKEAYAFSVRGESVTADSVAII